MKNWEKRALRTFFQAFAGTISTQLAVGQEITKTLLISLCASALAAGVAAAMNLEEEE